MPQRQAKVGDRGGLADLGPAGSIAVHDDVDPARSLSRLGLLGAADVDLDQLPLTFQRAEVVSLKLHDSRTQSFSKVIPFGASRSERVRAVTRLASVCMTVRDKSRAWAEPGQECGPLPKPT